MKGRQRRKLRQHKAQMRNELQREEQREHDSPQKLARKYSVDTPEVRTPTRDEDPEDTYDRALAVEMQRDMDAEDDVPGRGYVNPDVNPDDPNDHGDSVRGSW